MAPPSPCLSRHQHKPQHQFTPARYVGALTALEKEVMAVHWPSCLSHHIQSYDQFLSKSYDRSRPTVQQAVEQGTHPDSINRFVHDIISRAAGSVVTFFHFCILSFFHEIGNGGGRTCMTMHDVGWMSCPILTTSHPLYKHNFVSSTMTQHLDGLPAPFIRHARTVEEGVTTYLLLPLLAAWFHSMMRSRNAISMSAKKSGVCNIEEATYRTQSRTAMPNAKRTSASQTEVPLPSACIKCAKTPAEGAKFYFRNTCGNYHIQCVDCHNKHSRASHAARCANDEGYRARRAAAQAANRAANRAANPVKQKTPRVQFLDHIQFIQAHTQHWLLRDDKDLPMTSLRGRRVPVRVTVGGQALIFPSANAVRTMTGKTGKAVKAVTAPFRAFREQRVVLEAARQTTHNGVEVLCRGTWHGRLPPIPAAWKVARISPLFKNTDPTDPNKYRMLAVSSVLYRLYANVLRHVMTAWSMAHKVLPAEQFGFFPGRSTMQPMFILRYLVHAQKASADAKHRKLFTAFIDFKQAYDHIPRKQL
ncbi:hypothetical protein QJQ45_026921 [Haematococcus lacustris]|nr:hypothetical protein QJQ45_026921 [Haematococcus lacustris]